jgi:hypothetical protein
MRRFGFNEDGMGPSKPVREADMLMTLDNAVQ